MIKSKEILKRKNKVGFSQHNLFNKKDCAGFTLVELIVAVGIFSLIASMSLGAVLAIFDANRRSENSKTVVDNLNLTIEDMTRTIRFGYNYDCGSPGGDKNCSIASDTISLNFQGDTVVYKKCASAIKKSTNGASDCNSNDMKIVTSADTVIQDLKFYVFGVGTSGTERYSQPYVIAAIRGYVGYQPTIQSSFFIETMMSQRRIEYD